MLAVWYHQVDERENHEWSFIRELIQKSFNAFSSPIFQSTRYHGEYRFIIVFNVARVLSILGGGIQSDLRQSPRFCVLVFVLDFLFMPKCNAIH